MCVCVCLCVSYINIICDLFMRMIFLHCCVLHGQLIDSQNPYLAKSPLFYFQTMFYHMNSPEIVSMF